MLLHMKHLYDTYESFIRNSLCHNTIHVNDTCNHEPISFIHNHHETETFTAEMKQMNDISKKKSKE
jgi:hypothetical protein